MRIIVGFAAGGGADIAARLISQWLSERFAQQFVVEDHPGAGANIAMEAVAKAAPDGYTLLLVSPGAAINATLYRKLNYNFIEDIAPIGGILRVPNVMVVHPSVPARTVSEFIAYAKANPGKINMGSAGYGSSVHASGELFKMMTGVALTHIPYRGAGPMLADLIGGQVQVAFPDLMSSLEHIRAGKLRALAVTTAARSKVLPHIPSVGEFVAGYEASNWWGVGAPKHTPAPIVDTINKAINIGLADPGIEERLAQMGGVALTGPPGEFGKLIADETVKWAAVIKFAGLKVE